MIFHRSRLAWLLVVGAVLAVSRPAAADEYRNDSRHCAFEYPDTWCPITKDALAKMNALANQRPSGPKVQYVTGFQRRGQPPLSPPYILVQPVPTPKDSASYEEIEKSLAREFKTELKKVMSDANHPLSAVLKDVSTGTPVLDRATNRIILRIDANVPGVGKMQGLSVGFIGSQDIVFLHCYALDSEFDKYLPVFQGLFDTFKFDNGYEFKPGPGSSSILGNAGGGAIRGGLIGGIIGGLVALPVWLMQKRRKTQPLSSSNFAPVPPPPPDAPQTGITTGPRPN